MIERTKKQWHRYFIEEISDIVSEYLDKDNDVFVECGVKQGSSSVRMGQRLGIKGYLFDTWCGFPNFSDIDINLENTKQKMGHRIKISNDTYKDCISSLKKKGIFKLCTLIKGDILETVPKFVEDLNDFPIAMMHIDTDLYEPAKISLELFWPYVKKGGVVFFHDYGDKKWRGIKKVVDDLVATDNRFYVRVFDKNKLFSACVVKEYNQISENIFNKIIDLDK